MDPEPWDQFVDGLLHSCIVGASSAIRPPSSFFRLISFGWIADTVYPRGTRLFSRLFVFLLCVFLLFFSIFLAAVQLQCHFHQLAYRSRHCANIFDLVLVELASCHRRSLRKQRTRSSQLLSFPNNQSTQAGPEGANVLLSKKKHKKLNRGAIVGLFQTTTNQKKRIFTGPCVVVSCCCRTQPHNARTHTQTTYFRSQIAEEWRWWWWQDFSQTTMSSSKATVREEVEKNNSR